MYLLIKYSITAAIVVLVSELARRSDRLGALLASLPLVTVLTLVWLYIEKQPMEKLSNHMFYTFWYVLPTLPMFLLFPWLLQKLGFGLALAAWVGLSFMVYMIYAFIMRQFGINLL